MAAWGNDLYVGGNFQRVGDRQGCAAADAPLEPNWTPGRAELRRQRIVDGQSDPSQGACFHDADVDVESGRGVAGRRDAAHDLQRRATCQPRVAKRLHKSYACVVRYERVSAVLQGACSGAVVRNRERWAARANEHGGFGVRDRVPVDSHAEERSGRETRWIPESRRSVVGYSGECPAHPGSTDANRRLSLG